MRSWFDGFAESQRRFHKPSRIKNLRELEHGFMPKHELYTIRLVLAAMVLMIISVVSGLLEFYWVFVLAFWSLMVVFVILVLLKSVPTALRFTAYYSPWLGVKTAQLDSWLELDLDWGPPK